MSEAPPRSRASRPTIRDVARGSGVSIGTVSAVINGSASVSPQTRRQVLATVAELGYEPNSAARSLKRRRISSIGLIVPDLGNPFFAMVAEGVQRAAEANDVLLVLCITWAKSEREEYYAQVLKTQRLDGVLYLSGTGIPSPSLLELAREDQVVFVDECLPGIDVPFVNAANRSGARAIARHVLEAGHRRLAIVGGPPRLWTAEQRLAGYREAIAAAGLDPDAVPLVNGDYLEPSGYAAMRTLLAGGRARPTAVLCANDLMAMGVIRCCREAGIDVPGEISVAGFDDIPAAEQLHPPLTTVAQPAHQMGEAAAQLLLHRIGAGVDPPDQLEYATTLKIRSSVQRFEGR